MSTTEEEKAKQAAMKYKKIEVIARVVGTVAAVASVVVAVLALQNKNTTPSVVSPNPPSATRAASQNQNQLLNAPVTTTSPSPGVINAPVTTTSPSPNSRRPAQTTVTKDKSNDDNDDKDDKNERDSND